MWTSILPQDSRPNVEGHQVELNHGTNLITVIGRSQDDYDMGINTYSVEINRAGSAAENSTTVVSVSGLDRGSEGETIPFLLTRTGDVTQALTVPVIVAETGGDMVSSSSEGRFDVEFQAGYVLASFDVETNADTDWEEHSSVRVALVDGTGYDVGASGEASTYMWDDDFPESTAVLTVDPNPAEEGGEVTATITVTTNAAQQPRAYSGMLYLRTAPGTGDGAAGSDDFVLRAVNGGYFSVNAISFKPVSTDGVITAYQSAYGGTIAIVDDGVAEGAETFNVFIEVPKRSSRSEALTLDTTSTPSTVTISAHEEAPAQSIRINPMTVVTEDYGSSGTTFTITWENDDCPTGYNAYLDRSHEV